MAWIRKRKGLYQVNIRKKGYPSIYKSFHDLKDARKFARTIESQMERNVFEDYSNASGTTLRQILIKYRDEKTVLKKGSVEETSKINYLIKDKIGLNSLMRLKSHHLYKLMKELSVNRKPATVNKYINIICHAWRVAKREWGVNLPAENPCDMVTMQREPDARDRVLDGEEYSKLISMCEKLDKAPQTQRDDHLRILTDVVKFAYQTGARQGEILKLKRDHVDFNNKTCTFYDTKGGVDRTIPLADDTIGLIKRHVFGEYIFDCDARRLRKWFLVACFKSGIRNFRFHDLRACFCTNALLSGMSIAEVSAISGHRDWSQLKRYTRIKPQDLLGKMNNVVRLKRNPA